MKLTGRQELIKVLLERIEKDGDISFRDFMEVALYYPKYGYYTSDRSKIGGLGDYYTASELDPIFGQILARQFIEIYNQHFSKGSMDIVEIASGKGYLLHDLIKYLRENHIDIYDNLNIYSVEKSQYHLDLQRKVLKDFEKVKFYQDISDLPQVDGIIYSNELFDAIPTNLIEVEDGKVYEIYIAIEDGEVVQLKKEPSKEIVDYIRELNIKLPENFTTEINIDAVNLYLTIAGKLKRGFIFTIDYGYPSSELYKPYRNRGTLICYYRHTYNENYYQNVGLQDITSHVNFSALHHFGEKAGLKTIGFTDQAHFFISLGLMEELNKLYEASDYKSYERANRLKTLVLPKGMGEKFKVLIQAKDVKDVDLKGLELLPPPTDRYRL